MSLRATRWATRSIATASQKPCGYEAAELKAVNHRLDGAFWPRSAETDTPEQPVVRLEVQMHRKPGFKHRLFAQTARFLQFHPQVLHLAVVVMVPHRRLTLGPALLPQQLQAFVDGVIWLSLEELGRQADLDPLLTLLTLPVRPERSTAQAHHSDDSGTPPGNALRRSYDAD